MPRVFPGSAVPFTTTIKVDGVATDAPDILFIWRIGKRGDETTTVPTKTATGTYAVTVVPETSGTLYGYWYSDTLGLVEEVTINIAESAFNDETPLFPPS